MFYAELDENNICKAVSDLTGEVIAETMISLETYDTSFLGKKYVDGVWEEVPQEPTPEPEPSQLDRIESAVNDIAKNNTSYAEMAQAIAEGVNDIE